MKHHACHKASAFTLIELMLVMAIMMVLGLFAAIGVGKVRDHAMRRNTEATISLLEIALDEYKQDIGKYPAGDGPAMAAALSDPSEGWERAGMNNWFPKREDLKDAWGEDFGYCPNRLLPSEPYGEEYRYCGRGEGATTGRGVEQTMGKGNYYNLQTYQIYSKGPNMQTWPSETTDDGGNAVGHPRLGGTERDDIRNWEHEIFYTPQEYHAYETP